MYCGYYAHPFLSLISIYKPSFLFIPFCTFQDMVEHASIMKNKC